MHPNYDNKNGHWVVAVGYAVDENDNLTAILTLDPGNDSPKYSMWNGIIDLPKVPRTILRLFFENLLTAPRSR